MSGQAGSDHAAVECIERRQERRRAVALLVVRHRLAASLLERQAGLRAIESLDLRFFGAGEDQRVFGQREVESDDIVEFCGATGVVAELESVDAMRFAARGAPDATKRCGQGWGGIPCRPTSRPETRRRCRDGINNAVTRTNKSRSFWAQVSRWCRSTARRRKVSETSKIAAKRGVGRGSR